MNDPYLKITSPRQGDVLNRHDGSEGPDGLKVRVQGTASPGLKVTVNGAEAKRSEERFECEALIASHDATIEAQGEGGGTSCVDSVRVLWDKNSYPRFRFSIDDNIQFLKDLGTDPGAYRSLFDHWYLNFWRAMHQRFHTNVHINIYYQTDGFDLTQMPDKWKREWQDNGDWLHLSFHALQDKPDRPYRNAKYPQMAHDFDLVMSHIYRFAGQEVTGRETTVHWAEAPAEALVALPHRGVDRIISLFGPDGKDCTTKYYIGPEMNDYLYWRDYWHDFDRGITFIQCDMVVNGVALANIKPQLDSYLASPHTSELVELLIHEQYFRKELSYHLPDVMDRVVAALEWVSERNYKPVFWSWGFCGNANK
ncbi:MAG: hypothetical protein IT210_25550 [Armatimonadetes bacterium]|nr:hypothetical protein [Armatimonadota bacterium]